MSGQGEPAPSQAPVDRSDPVVATRSGVARDHIRFAARDPEALLVTALRTKSIHARELLAEAALPGATAADILQWASSGAAVPETMGVAAAARFGQALALQTGGADDVAAGMSVLSALYSTDRNEEMPPRSVDLLAQLRLAVGDRSGTEQVLEDPRVRVAVARALRADAANPLGPTAGGGLDPGADSEGVWLELLHEALYDQGSPVAPLELRPPSGPGELPFDRLTAHAPPVDPAITASHPVTVIMSAYQPGPEMLVAARSVLEQSWDNLELLIVHDASGEEYRPILDRAAALDPRVRVIHKAVNGGTYRARNTALRQATGEFTLVLDSDDWMHPQMVEWSVRTLLARPQLVAVRSQCVRTTEELVLTRPGYVHRMLSAASLTFRTQQVINRIGFFDPTSKSADTEFARRILVAFGQRVRNLPHVGALLRSGDTLSSSEFSAGWRHTTRLAYKSAYGMWHREIRAGAAPFLDPDARRVIAEPRRWGKPADRAFAPASRIDLCLAGDWRRFGGPQRSMLEEIVAARAAGLRVGIMHLEAFRFMTRQDDPLCAAVLELVQSGDVEWVHPDDDVEIDVLMLRYPPIMQYPPARPPSTARVRRVLLMANQAPIEPDGSDQRYVVRDVTDRTEEFFGVAPEWVPQSPMIRRVLREQDPTVAMVDWDNPGLIDLDQWWVRDADRIPGTDGPVVVGRYSRDNEIKFGPTFEEVLSGYSFEDRYEVRMMGALHTIIKLAEQAGVPREELPENWVLTRHKTQEVTEFLEGLDFFLYLDNADTREAFGRVLLEAAASGVLTIAHPKHRETFGEVLDYALPGEAQALIDSYVADPIGYRRRVEKSRQLVTERFGHAGFVARLGRLEPGDANRETPEQAATTEEPQQTDEAGAFDRPERSGPLRVGSGLHLRAVVMRSAADAERSDTLWVTHDAAAGIDDEVDGWLRQSLEAAGQRQFEQELLSGPVPSGVIAVAVERDGATRLVAAPMVDLTGLPQNATEQGPCGGSGGSGPDGWTAWTWWPDRHPRPGDPVQIDISAGVLASTAE